MSVYAVEILFLIWTLVVMAPLLRRSIATPAHSSAP